MVFAREQKDAIITRATFLSGEEAGTQGYLGHHQKAAKEMFDELPKAQVKEYEKQAIEWNSEGVPAELQLQ